MLLRRAREKNENNNTSLKYFQCISTSTNMADYITYYLNFSFCVLAILLLAEKKKCDLDYEFCIFITKGKHPITLLATVDKTVI